MSKEDYEQDFELRYLIRSRVRSFLNSYSQNNEVIRAFQKCINS